MNFKDIDAERKRQRRAIGEFCRAAGVSRATYQFHLRGKNVPSPVTLKSYRNALEGRGAKLAGRRRLSGADGDALIAATYRAAVHALCTELRADPEKVLSAVPAQRATASADWMEAARVRGLSVACLAMALGLPAARIAAAIGVTRAAASDMLHRAEDLWEHDPALEALVKRVGKSVGGEEISW